MLLRLRLSFAVWLSFLSNSTWVSELGEFSLVPIPLAKVAALARGAGTVLRVNLLLSLLGTRAGGYGDGAENGASGQAGRVG